MHLRLVHTEADVERLQSVLLRAPAFYLLDRGGPPADDEARQVLLDHPPGRTAADKRLWLVLDADEAIGCVEVADGWPVARTSMIGLLLVVAERYGDGTSHRLYRLVEDDLRSSADRLRIGVLSKNARALAFWTKHGFIPTGERQPHERGSVVDELVLFEKHL